MKQLDTRVAVVTGAGSGIGQATSVLLAQSGCRLALADVNERGLEETQRRIVALGRDATIHRVDVSDRAQVQRLSDEVMDHYGAVHILMNNAGVSVNARFSDLTLADFEWLMGVNFWGVVYGCKSFLPHLLAAAEAHIVNISSLFGLIGVPQQTAYCASKFAVRGFSEALRAELVSSQVGLTCVHPGGIATNIAANSRVSGDDVHRKRHERAIQRFKKMLPPERAAQQIVRAITRGQSRLLIARETFVIDAAKRIAPTATDHLVEWGFKRAVH
jgi:NADP-dependent 3-hydroxy acid dehydrogenase YdfG